MKYFTWKECTHSDTALRILSGYRCEALNRAVGGMPNSAHCTGYPPPQRPHDRLPRFLSRVLG
ncbi:hypothetical protein B5E60_13355 [Alistipes sp. An116]|uniref:D-Ala-D-Ala carboxypeptidase family metallohydrolase n=1 Tax=Alistipes sp. An116 TaxID=1965546 RepID=UPI000B373E86|nr:hypothetical protein B5E60_13355 [Alistipes sp. An116]